MGGEEAGSQANLLAVAHSEETRHPGSGDPVLQKAAQGENGATESIDLHHVCPAEVLNLSQPFNFIPALEEDTHLTSQETGRGWWKHPATKDKLPGATSFS